MNTTCEIPRWQILKQNLVNLDPAEFISSFKKDADAVLIDVRTEDELGDQLPGALHLDYLGDGFLDQLEALDRDKTYYIYCRTGRRSVRTGILMQNWGFEGPIVNMDGGISML